MRTLNVQINWERFATDITLYYCLVVGNTTLTLRSSNTFYFHDKVHSLISKNKGKDVKLANLDNTSKHYLKLIHRSQTNLSQRL